MNLKKFIGCLTAGVALAIGVGVGLGAKEQVRESRANDTSTTVYCAIDSSTIGSYTLKANAKLQGDKTDSESLWATATMTDTGETYKSLKVYSGTFVATYDGVSKLQFQLYDGETFVEEHYGKGGSGDWTHDWTGSAWFEHQMFIYSTSTWEDTNPTPHDYSLVGTFNGWDETDTDYDFEKNVAGTEATLVANLSAGAIFKIVEDHAWTVSYGWGNVDLSGLSEYIYEQNESTNIKILEPGSYTITISINTTSYAVTGITMTGTATTVYTVTFGETTYNLARNISGDHDAQYVGKVNAVSGQTPAFKKSDSAISATADVTDNENINTINGTVLESANNVDLWLHVDIVEEVETYTFWLAGRQVTYYLYVGGTLHPMSLNPNDDTEYMATSIAVDANDKIRFYTASLFDATVSGSAGGTWTIVDGQIEAGEAGTFNFYFKPDMEGNTVYIDNLSDADKAAIAYAELFLDTLKDENTPICQVTPQGVVQTDFDDLSTAWGTLKTAFQAIDDDDAKGILQNASVVGESKVNEFAALYDHIVRSYSSRLGEGYNFVARAGLDSVNFTLRAVYVDNTTMIIVLSASIALVSATGLFFFARKKKAR